MFKYAGALTREEGLFLPEKDTAFLNIETTGLSYRNSFIYMAGIAWAENAAEEGSAQSDCGGTAGLKCVCLLSESRRDEADILWGLRQLTGRFSSVITYGGSIFTQRFLEGRRQLYDGMEVSRGPVMTDILERIRPCRKYLPLADLKKMNAEKFAGYQRKVNVSGPELISVYQQWENSHAAETRDFLIDHCLEDLSSLCCLSGLLAYPDFLEGRSFEKTEAELTDGGCIFHVRLSRPVPSRLCWNTEYAETVLDGYTADISVRGVRGRMRYFLPGPVGDYYYLPDEDMAVHSSVAQFVDKEHRKKATPATCYITREGLFLPAPKTRGLDMFREEYHSQKFYILCDREKWKADPSILRVYITAVVRQQ